MIRGVIFDLDGTLVESHLDFAALRRAMNLPEGTLILEAIAAMGEEESRPYREILRQFELDGVQRATVMPGVPRFLEQLDARGIYKAVVTRNSRAMARTTLARLQLEFDLVMSRDDGPAKPDPWALLQICESWGLAPKEVAMIGDFRLDVEAGRRAGTRTVLFTNGRDPNQVPGADQADFCLASFTNINGELRRLLTLADEP